MGISLKEAGFDANEVRPLADDLPEVGIYEVQAINAEIMTSGKGIFFEFKITAGAYKNYTLKKNFLIYHENEIAKKIAFQGLSSLARASQKMDLDNPEDIYGIDIKIKYDLRYNKKEQKYYKEIVQFYVFTDSPVPPIKKEIEQTNNDTKEDDIPF